MMVNKMQKTMLRVNNLTEFLGCYHLRHYCQHFYVTVPSVFVLRGPCTKCAMKGAIELRIIICIILFILIM